MAHYSFIIQFIVVFFTAQTFSHYSTYWNPPNQQYGQNIMDIQQNLVSSNLWSKAPAFSLNSATYSQPYQYHNILLPVFPSFTRLENPVTKTVSATTEPQQQSNSYENSAPYDNRLQYSPIITRINFRPTAQANEQNKSSTDNYIGSVVELKKPLQKAVDESDLTQISHNNPIVLPPFLKRASSEIQKKFIEIITNPNEGFLQKQKKLDTLVNELDEESQQIYKQYQHSKDQEEQAKRERIHETVATMSQNAQIIFAKISAVLTNRELSDAERWQKLYNIYSSMAKETRKEFNERFGELL